MQTHQPTPALSCSSRRGAPYRRSRAWLALAAGTTALVTVAGAAAVGWVPWLSVGAAALLVMWNSSSSRLPPLPVKTLGWTQMLVGAVVVAAFAAGHHFGW